MKYYLITAVLAVLSFSCERKETTIVPAAEKETTIIAPANKTEKKTEVEKTVTPDGSTIQSKETTTEQK